MNCPACKKPLLTLELNRVEIEYCPSCEGIWLDKGELELMLDDSPVRDDFMQSLQVATETKEKRRRCPLCRKKMEKISSQYDPGIVADRCGGGHGIWLDEGELQAILKLGNAGRESKVLALLNDMFAHNLKSKNTGERK